MSRLPDGAGFEPSRLRGIVAASAMWYYLSPTLLQGKA